jgi:hypothetical protein
MYGDMSAMVKTIVRATAAALTSIFHAAEASA